MLYGESLMNIQVGVRMTLTSRAAHLAGAKAARDVGGSIIAVRTGVPDNESICACHKI